MAWLVKSNWWADYKVVLDNDKPKKNDRNRTVIPLYVTHAGATAMRDLSTEAEKWRIGMLLYKMVITKDRRGDLAAECQSLVKKNFAASNAMLDELLRSSPYSTVKPFTPHPDPCVQALRAMQTTHLLLELLEAL